jgi:tetratricopeptide (TPR) repeat protein
MAKIKHPLFLCVVTVLVLVAVRLAFAPRNVVSVAAVPGGTAAAYAAGAADLDAQVIAAEARISRQPDSWMDVERAANMHLNRGRYCDRWDDYAAADSLMARAFEIAPEGAGPFLGRARLNFTMHRFDQVEADLVRAESQLLLSPRVHSEIEALRADVALEQGRFDDALAAYRRAAGAQRNFDTLARLAGGLAKSESLDAADATYAQAAAALPRSATKERAWVSLQRGLVALQANDLDRALRHYREAKQQFPGWWLADEHIAEALALQGHDERAMAIYQDVLARTGDPEFMDAMARIYRSRGDEANATHWIALARKGHAARLARFPEAAAGHAKQHVKDFGPITGGA